MSIRKPLSLLITLALVCGLVPTPALAEVMDGVGEAAPLEAAPAQDDEGTAAAEAEPEGETAAPEEAGDAAEGEEPAAVPADDPDPETDPEPAADPDDAGPARADVEGDVNLYDKYLHYKDEESGYWYSYTVTSYDVGTKTGTARLSNVQYIKPDSDWGRDAELPDGVEPASVDFTYPTTLSANVSEHQIDSMYPEARFTVTALEGLPALPSFRSVHVPASVTELSGESYLDDNVTQVTFDPDCPITAIPKRFFERERQLEEPTLPATVETIGDRAFAGCGFASFTMPQGLKSIGEGAFEGCGSLAAVTFNEGLESIGNSAFRNTMLTELNLPSTLLTIGDYAFCKDPVVYDLDAFEGYSVDFQFDTVVIPDSVTSIGTYAFARSYNANNTGLTAISNVTLGKGLKTVGQLAFQDASITTLELPASLESLDIEEGGWSGPFDGCALLERVTFDDLDHAQLETMGGFTNCTALASVEIPSSVTSIAPLAFNSCEALESIALPPTVTSIGRHAFVGTGLKRLTIPGSVKTIGESAFYGCESLSKLTLEEGVETIGDQAFDKTPALTSLVIPSSVSSIGYGAFRGGDYRQGMNSWQYQLDSYGGGLTSLVIRAGDTPLSIGGSAFEFCEGLNGKTIVLPQRVSSIGGGAFLGIANATFEVYNPNIALAEGKSSLSIYNATAEQATAFPEELVFHNEDDDTYEIFIPDPWSSDDHYMQNRLPKPNGTKVRYPASLTSETAPTFALLVANNTSEGYHPTYETFDTSGGDAPVEEPADITPAGRLLVTTTGDAGTNANVCVFDADGGLVARARASRGYAPLSGIEPGTYTVVAFAKNDSFSTVSSLDALATLGLDTSDYATKTGVKIAADKDTEITLSVPKLSSIGSFTLLKSSSVAIAKQNVYQNAEFTATINYVMDLDTANYLVVKLPKGVTPTSVASVNKNYGTSGFDEASRTLTVAIDDVKDQSSGRIYLGLKATTTGKKTVSASVVSGDLVETGMTFPLGSASTTCTALTLEVPTDPVHGKTFEVTAYAAPHTTVTFNVAGQTIVDTTNAVGRVTVSIDLTDVETTLTYTMVIATVGEGDDAVSTSAMVEFALTETEPYKLKDYSFIHANKQYYIVEGGRAKPKTDYYIYIANGEEKNKYWTFEAIYESASPMWIGSQTSAVVQNAYATARVQMMDGSSRYVKMPITRSEKQGDNYLNYFGGSLYLDQAGDHVFFTSLIPVAFDISLHSNVTAGEFMDNPGAFIVKPTQADFDVLRDRSFAPLQAWQGRVEEKANKATANSSGESTWDKSKNYAQALFFTVDDTGADLFGTKIIWEDFRHELQENGFSTEEIAETIDKAKIVAQAAKDVADAYDMLLDADVPMSEFDNFPDYISENTGLETGRDFNLPELLDKGYEATNDTGAAGANEAAATQGVTRGTPTGSIEGNATPTFKIPDTHATRRNENADGSAKSYSYADSNGTRAEIKRPAYLEPGYFDKPEVAKQWDDSNAKVNDAKTATALAKGYFEAKAANHPQGIIGLDLLADYSDYINNGAQIMGAATSSVQRVCQSVELSDHYKNAAEARGNVDYLEIRLNYLRMHGDTSSDCYKALKEERDWAIIVADGLAAHRDWNLTEMVRAELVDWIGATVGTETGPVGTTLIYVGDQASAAVVADGMDKNQRVLNPALKKLNDAHRKRMEDCGDDDDYAKHAKNVILDPSGVVYEAFPANKLEGVTATVYAAGESDAWNAAEYDQRNPQVTGDDGFFGWDVPTGDWQVKFEKDGYETYTTDPMQVPPPRTDLEIGLVATAGPQIASVTADTQSVEVVFDQWMDANTLYQVDVNGVAASDVEWVDPVEGATSGQYFSKVLRLPVPEGTKVGNKLSVKVHDAENYAGKHLGEATFDSVEVKPRPSKIVMNFEDTLSLQAGTARPTSVRVYDGEGNPVEGAQVTASLDNGYLASVDASSAVTNADGMAKVQLEALLPGMCTLTVGVEGTSLKRSIKLLTTVDTNTVARPTAKAGSVTIGAGAPAENDITVTEGTKLELSCETEGATIYYTTDGTSCPCQNTPARKTYTGPITLDENVKLIIGAYKDGMDYSERLRINVTVASKKANTLSVVAAKKTVQAPKVAAAAQTVPALVVKGAQGALTYKKLSGSAGLSVNAKGQIVVAKGTAAGTHTIKVRTTAAGNDTYKAGSVDTTVTVSIVKANQTLTVKAVKKTAKASKVKKKAVKVKRPLKVTGAQGTLSYKKKGGSKKLSVNAKTGKVTVKKGTKKGTYKIKIRVTSAATGTYNAASKTVTCKVVVK